MLYRQIKNTDLKVSVISLGTMTFGTPVPPERSSALVRYAFEQGINFIDTANMYEGYARVYGSAGGVAEECIGKAVKGIRHSVVIATKVGMKVGETPLDDGVSPAAIEHNLTKSLKRLDTDYVDIYYAHRHDPAVAPEELAGAMCKEMQKGRIRHYAVSNYTGNQLLDLLRACDENNFTRPVLCQPPLSLINLDSLCDIINICSIEGISVVPYKILHGGLLTGKYQKGRPAPLNSRKKEQPNWLPDLPQELNDRLDEIRKTCEGLNVPMTQYAIRFALNQPNVVSAIVGVKNEAQIDAALNSIPQGGAGP